MDRKRGLFLGCALALSGLALSYYGYYEGFPVPGVEGPFKSSFTVSTKGDRTTVDRAEWKKSDVSYDEWRLTDDGKVVTEPDEGRAAGVSPRVAAGGPSTKATKTTEASKPETKDPVPEAGTSTTTSFANGKVAYRLPSGWRTTESNRQRVIAERRFADGSTLRVMITDVSDRAGAGLEELHEQHLDYMFDWISPTDDFVYDDAGTESTTAGLTFKVTALYDPDVPDYYYAALTTIKDGRGLWVSFDGPEDIPDSAEADVKALLDSLRISR